MASAPRSLLVLAVVAGTSPAGADSKPKFVHDSRVVVDAKLTERSSAPVRRADAAPTPVAPPPDPALALATSLAAIQEQQVVVLRELYAQTPKADVAERADALFRLGELHAKIARAHRLEATRLELEAGRAPAPRRAAIDAERARHAARATAATTETVRTLGVLVNDDTLRGFVHRDVALFYLGYTLQQAGRVADARVAYDRLLKDHPQSRYVAEAHLAFADYFFEAGKLADAEARYKQVLQFPQASVYWYAQYKLGWVAYNLARPTEALEAFYRVAQGTRDAAHAELHRSARKDFVRAYAEVGRADKALAAFARVEASHQYDMLETLADLYFDQGKADRAVYAYRELIAAQPTSARVCRWEHGATRGMLALGTPAERVAEIQRLAKLYVAVRDRKQVVGDDLAECRDATIELTDQMARALHQEAMKTKQAETFALADQLYATYLTTFPDAADAGDARYFRAELAWARAELPTGGTTDARAQARRWGEVADAFAAAVERGGLDATRVAIAADAAMLARMRALHVDPLHRAPPDAGEAAYARVPTPAPLGDDDRALLAALDGYLAHVKDPANGERVDVQFQKAALLRRFAHHAESVAIFEDIALHHRDHEAAETAAQLALDDYNRLQRYDRMFALADQLGADAKFLADKPALATTIGTLRRQALRRQAEQAERAGREQHDLAAFVRCANQYVAIYNLAPLADDADQILYDAGVCFEEGHSVGAAQQMYRNLEKLFPKSPLAAKSLARLGNAYAQTAFYREASEKFEEYAGRYAGERDAYDLLSDAVLFRKGVGDDARAIEDTKTFVALYGKSKPRDAAAAFWSLGAIYEKHGGRDGLLEVARHYRAYVDRYAEVGGDDGAERAAVAWAKVGLALWEHACPVATIDGACVTVTREVAIARAARPRVTAAREGGPARCGDASKTEVVVIARDPAEAARAQQAFAKALALAGALPAEVRARAGVRYHVAQATLGALDRDYERYLAAPLPQNLDFDARKPAIAQRSLARFDAWFGGKSKAFAELRERYLAVIAMKDAPSGIVAAARVGQIGQAFSGQLYRASIPANLRVGPYADDAIAAYCDKLAEVAEPLERDALDAYQACLTTSTRLGWFSPYSRLCERELGQLEPEAWPTMAELHASAEHVGSIRDVEAAPKL